VRPGRRKGRQALRSSKTIGAHLQTDTEPRRKLPCQLAIALSAADRLSHPWSWWRAFATSLANRQRGKGSAHGIHRHRVEAVRGDVRHDRDARPVVHGRGHRPALPGRGGCPGSRAGEAWASCRRPRPARYPRSQRVDRIDWDAPLQERTQIVGYPILPLVEQLSDLACRQRLGSGQPLGRDDPGHHGHRRRVAGARRAGVESRPIWMPIGACALAGLAHDLGGPADAGAHALCSTRCRLPSATRRRRGCRRSTVTASSAAMNSRRGLPRGVVLGRGGNACLAR
jgi:hypothetical protein